MSLALFIVPKYLGYYEQEGLDVELLFAGGANEAAIQLATGNAEIADSSPAQAVIGMEEGSAAPMDIRYFYNAGYRNIWSVSVPEDSPIKTIADLRGKKIGVTALGQCRHDLWQGLYPRGRSQSGYGRVIHCNWSRHPGRGCSEAEGGRRGCLLGYRCYSIRGRMAFPSPAQSCRKIGKFA